MPITEPRWEWSRRSGVGYGYLEIRPDAEIARTVEIDQGAILVDYDKSGNIVGIEVVP